MSCSGGMPSRFTRADAAAPMPGKLEVHTYTNGLRITRLRHGAVVSIPSATGRRLEEYIHAAQGLELPNVGPRWNASASAKYDICDPYFFFCFYSRKNIQAVKLITGPKGSRPWQLAFVDNESWEKQIASHIAMSEATALQAEPIGRRAAQDENGDVEVYTVYEGLRFESVRGSAFRGWYVSIPSKRKPLARYLDCGRPHQYLSLAQTSYKTPNVGSVWTTSNDHQTRPVDPVVLWGTTAGLDIRRVKLITGPGGSRPWKLALRDDLDIYAEADRLAWLERQSHRYIASASSKSSLARV